MVSYSGGVLQGWCPTVVVSYSGGVLQWLVSWGVYLHNFAKSCSPQPRALAGRTLSPLCIIARSRHSCTQNSIRASMHSAEIQSTAPPRAAPEQPELGSGAPLVALQLVFPEAAGLSRRWIRIGGGSAGGSKAVRGLCDWAKVGSTRQ